jgi:hypothetical protein
VTYAVECMLDHRKEGPHYGDEGYRFNYLNHAYIIAS